MNYKRQGGLSDLTFSPPENHRTVGYPRTLNFEHTSPCFTQSTCPRIRRVCNINQTTDNKDITWIIYNLGSDRPGRGHSGVATGPGFKYQPRKIQESVGVNCLTVTLAMETSLVSLKVSASCSQAGAILLQCPHQGAKNLMKWDPDLMWSSNVSTPRSTTASASSGLSSW